MRIPAPGSRPRTLLCLAALLLLAAVLRLPPALKRQVVNIDEGTLAAVAGTVLDGGLPYRDSWDTRGPVTFYLYAGAFALGGRGDMLGVHLLAALAVVMTAFFLLLLGRELREEGVGELAAFLYVLLSFAGEPADFLAANVELFMVPFVAAGAWVFVRAARAGSRGGLFLAGGLLGGAFLTKQPALFDFLGLLAFALLALNGAPLGRPRTAAWMAGGFLAPVAATVACFAARGGLPDFLFGFWTYSAKYFMPALPAGERWRMAWEGPWPLLRGNPYAWGSAAAGAALAAAAARVPGGGRLLLVPVIWALTAFAGASSSGRGFGHYYIQLLPPLAFLSAWFTVRFLPRLAGAAAASGDRRATGPGEGRRARVGARLAAGLAAAAYLAPLAPWFHPGDLAVLADARDLAARPPGERNRRNLGPAMKELVGRIDEGSGPEESIFVWGFLPNVYLVSGRKPATRFSYCIYLTGLVPWVNTGPGEDTSRWIVPGSWDLLMGDLEASRPAFIVDTAPGDAQHWGKYPISKFPRLERFVSSDYLLDRVIADHGGKDQFHLYRRADIPPGAAGKTGT